MEMSRAYRALVLAATGLAFLVVVVGAYVRLMDAGLGCPDWPGCYGELSPAHARDAIDKAVEAQGGEHGPVSLRKAWKEMVHRYLAGTLGLAIAAIAVGSWHRRMRSFQSPALPTALLGLVILQAALGMWTVTLLLKPVIVSLHLLGGMTTLALLVWLSSRQLGIRAARTSDAGTARLRPWLVVGLFVLAVQIALGAWVSSNYAALACVDFPKCHGTWVPDMDFQHGFQLVRDLGRTATGDHLAYTAITAIHWTHRVGALITFLYLSAMAFLLVRTPGTRPFGALLGVLLVVQIGLGIANILAGLPLAIAVSHNAVAALLLASLVMINFALSRSPSQSLR
jgi:cytochrome c oxidase assembly protein subunit 15